jgi:hypothetical protein
MRKTIRDLLLASAPLTNLVPAERWYSPGAVLDHPVTPFVVLRWIAPVLSGGPGQYAHQLRVDVHDKRGSYANIEALLGGPYKANGVYSILFGLAGVTGADGYIAQTDYLGESGDQEDETYATNYMFSSWQICGRKQ